MKVTGNENVMHILDVVGYVINLYYKLLFAMSNSERICKIHRYLVKI